MVAELTILDRFFDLMMDNPSPEAIMKFRALPAEDERMTYLLEKRVANTLSLDERVEVERLLDANRLIGRAKSRAFARMNSVDG